MNLFCKMVIGCNPQIMDFITLWHPHCVVGVGKDSSVIGVDKDSGHSGGGRRTEHSGGGC